MTKSLGELEGFDSPPDPSPRLRLPPARRNRPSPRPRQHREKSTDGRDNVLQDRTSLPSAAKTRRRKHGGGGSFTTKNVIEPGKKINETARINNEARDQHEESISTRGAAHEGLAMMTVGYNGRRTRHFVGVEVRPPARLSQAVAVIVLMELRRFS
jgi:hypothetical protein